MKSHIDAGDLSAQLADRIDDLVLRLLPAARRSGAYFTIGNVAGDPGKSCFIYRAGERAGRWCDAATGERGDMLDLIGAVLNLDTRSAMKWALAYLGLSVRPVPTGQCAPMPATPPPRREHDNRHAALALWAGARPIVGTLGERYLRARGIGIDLPPSMRFADALLHVPTGLRLPALIAAIAGPDFKITAVTRIYLRADGRGKAGVSPPKMTLGPMRDGAVRLAPAGEILGLAEGVESALSASQLYNVPVWATLGAGRLATVAVPDAVTRLVIFGDRGEAGEAAAERARQAHARPGRVVQVVYPVTGADFNDDLRAEIQRGAA